MNDLLMKLGWGTTSAALIGGALLLSRYTGLPIALMIGSAAAAAVHKMRDSASLTDAAAHAAPGIAAGAGSFFIG